MTEFNPQASIDQMAKDLGMDSSIPASNIGIPTEEELRERGISISPTNPAVHDMHYRIHQSSGDVPYREEQSSSVPEGENLRTDITKTIENFSEMVNAQDEKVVKEKEVVEQVSTLTTPQQKFEDLFKNLTVDLNNIEVVDANPMNKFKNFNFVMNKKSKTQIVALQSGYVAYVEGYNYDEINALLNSTLDDYALQLLLTQTVYKSINTTSAGNFSFDEWTERTSYYDLDSFIYGNYLETFPGTTNFKVRCGTCGKNIDAKVNNDTLISANNDTTKELVSYILENKNNPEDTMSKAIIRTTKKLFLEDSKVIVEFKLPTIKKHLELLSEINPTAKDKNKHILTMMLFLENIYMIDVEATMASGTPKYNKVTDRDEVSRILKNLTYADAKAFTDGINELITRYSVQYQISSFPCSACGADIGNIPVDMETLLFFRMNQ